MNVRSPLTESTGLTGARPRLNGRRNENQADTEETIRAQGRAALRTMVPDESPIATQVQATDQQQHVNRATTRRALRAGEGEILSETSDDDQDGAMSDDDNSRRSDDDSCASNDNDNSQVQEDQENTAAE